MCARSGRPGGEFPAVVPSHGATSTGALHLERDWGVHDISNMPTCQQPPLSSRAPVKNE